MLCVDDRFWCFELMQVKKGHVVDWFLLWSKDICKSLPTSYFMALQTCYGFDWIACRSKVNAMDVQHGDKPCKSTALVWSHLDCCSMIIDVACCNVCYGIDAGSM